MIYPTVMIGADMLEIIYSEQHVMELVEMYYDYTADEFDNEQELHYQEMVEDWSAGEDYDYYCFRLREDICECTAATLFSEGCQCGVGYFQRKMSVIQQFVEDYTMMHQTTPDPNLRSAIMGMSNGITEKMDPYIKLALSDEDQLMSLYWEKQNPHKDIRNRSSQPTAEQQVKSFIQNKKES